MIDPAAIPITEDTKRALFRRLFGREGSFEDVRPIHRSFGKLTYQLAGPNQSRLILQVWLLDEDARARALAAQFGLSLDVVHSLWQYGSRHVVNNTRALADYGLAVPPILLADDSRSILPQDYVIYDFIDGETLDRRRLKCDPSGIRRLELAMARTLGQMHAFERSWPGSFSRDEADALSCQQVCLDQVRSNVSHAAAGSVLVHHGPHVLEMMEQLVQELQPRTAFRATHGDLQPAHYLIDSSDTVWLLDLELVKFFDVEYDVCRFGLPMALTSAEFTREYSRYTNHAPDEERVRFYELYWLVSSVAFLDRAAMDSVDFTSEPLRRQLETTLRKKLSAFAGSAKNRLG